MTFTSNTPTGAIPTAVTAKPTRLTPRHPRRISVTVSYAVHEALVARSNAEGRSVSNLCAFLLEESVHPEASLLLRDRA